MGFLSLHSRKPTAGQLSPTSVAATSALILSFNANAANILFAHVDNYGSHVDNGNRIAQFLSDGGHSVTTRFLDSAVYNDYSSFDQIFVYDLYHLSDTSATQMAIYSGIANWYNGLSDQNLILDGRIISSDVNWTNANSMSSEAMDTKLRDATGFTWWWSNAGNRSQCISSGYQ